MTTPTSAEVADILDKAADHLNRVGWMQGYLYDEVQAEEKARQDCPACAVGAINTVVYGTPSYPIYEQQIRDTAVAAETVLAEHLGLGILTIPQWNDDAERTAEQVVQAFRDTAASLRAEAAA